MNGEEEKKEETPAEELKADESAPAEESKPEGEATV